MTSAPDATQRHGRTSRSTGGHIIFRAWGLVLELATQHLLLAFTLCFRGLHATRKRHTSAQKESHRPRGVKQEQNELPKRQWVGKQNQLLDKKVGGKSLQTPTEDAGWQSSRLHQVSHVNRPSPRPQPLVTVAAHFFCRNPQPLLLSQRHCGAAKDGIPPPSLPAPVHLLCIILRVGVRPRLSSPLLSSLLLSSPLLTVWR